MDLWRNVEQLPAQTPRAIKSWLSEAGSLTQYLRELNAEALTLHLHRVGFDNMSTDEQQWLNNHGRAWCREITFTVNTACWEWSRVVIPEISLQGNAAALQTWGESPLGDLLFQDRDLQRSPLLWCKLKADDAYFNQACQYIHDTPLVLWARRSVLHFYGQPLLIIEVLMPDLAQQLQTQG